MKYILILSVILLSACGGGSMPTDQPKPVEQYYTEADLDQCDLQGELIFSNDGVQCHFPYPDGAESVCWLGECPNMEQILHDEIFLCSLELGQWIDFKCEIPEILKPIQCKVGGYCPTLEEASE